MAIRFSVKNVTDLLGFNLKPIVIQEIVLALFYVDTVITNIIVYVITTMLHHASKSMYSNLRLGRYLFRVRVLV